MSKNNYSLFFIIGGTALFFIFGGLLIWNIIKTEELQTYNNKIVKVVQQKTPILYNTYNPVIYKVLSSNSVSIQESTLNSAIPIYQYIGLHKSHIPLIDSIKTPSNALPLFNPLLKKVKFNTNIENGDIIMHGYYDTPVIMDGINPVAAVYFVYYESCFQYENFTNLCWNGSDFCSYPFIINFALPNQFIINNLQQALTYGQQNINNDVRINPSNGCFYITLDKDLVNDVKNTVVINPPNTNPFILTIGTQLGTKVFKLCTTTYTEDDLFEYYVPTISYYDFYINYGDGTPTEHHVGMFGIWTPITHTYSANAPVMVNVTILGIVPGWSCLPMTEQGGGVNPMTIDIISWGNVSLRQADFYYESNMVAISAGSPPPSMEGFLYFFPYNANPNVWKNLNTWNVNNMVNGMGMFSTITKGTLDLRGWVLPKLKYSAYMFFQTKAPIIGELRDLRPVSLEHAEYMFLEYASNELDFSNLRTPNLISAKGMFKFTSSFPNLNITYWTTSNLKNIEEMFFGCNEIKPIFTFWNMKNITSCDHVIQSSNYEAIRKISSSADYNQILIDFESKTNSTGLICNWNNAGQFFQPINGLATGSGLIARTNLVNRGWLFYDINTRNSF